VGKTPYFLVGFGIVFKFGDMCHMLMLWMWCS